jgi:imidazolonepropionase-like amidohydrolase
MTTRLAVAILPLLAVRAAAQADSLTVVTNVTVIDVGAGRARSGMAVVIDRGRIVSVAPTAGASRGRRIDGTGKFLIPGLWDMHVHLAFGDWFPRAREISLPLFVANGVTAVRDMGSDFAPVAGWRREIDAGKLIGPRIVTSGPMLDGPKPRFPASIAIATPEDGRRAVRDLKRMGVDFVKLQSLIPREAVFAILEEARAQGLVVVGHVPDAVRAREASTRGQKSFEHLIGVFEGSSPDEDVYLTGAKSPGKFLATYDPKRAAALFSLLARNRTWQCPTLVWERGANEIEESDFATDPLGKYAPAAWKTGAWKRFTDQIEHEFNVDDLATRKRFVAKELELVAGLHRAGVPFLAGTDTPPGVFVFPGFSLHEELARFVAAGFTPAQALATATTNPARFLGLERQLGSVAPGKVADLVLLDANPLADIGNTRRIAGVFLRGRWLARADLDRLLAGAEAAARAN